MLVRIKDDFEWEPCLKGAEVRITQQGNSIDGPFIKGALIGTTPAQIEYIEEQTDGYVLLVDGEWEEI